MQLHIAGKTFQLSLIRPPLLPILPLLTALRFAHRKRGNAYHVSVSRGRRSPCCCRFLVKLNVVWQATELSPISLPHTQTHTKTLKGGDKAERRSMQENLSLSLSVSLSLMSGPSSLFLLFFFLSPHSEPSVVFCVLFCRFCYITSISLLFHCFYMVSVIHLSKMFLSSINFFLFKTFIEHFNCSIFVKQKSFRT